MPYYRGSTYERKNARARASSVDAMQFDGFQPLAGQDKVYGDPGESQPFDWQQRPQAPPKRRAQDLRSWIWPTQLQQIQSDLDQFFGIGQALTFELQNERQAAAKQRSQMLRTHSDQHLNDTLLGQDTLFGAPGETPSIDWQQRPQPAAKSRAQDLRSWLCLSRQDDLEGGASGAQPPTIARRPPPLANRTWLWQNSNDTLSAIAQQMYGDPGEVPAYDWQLPKLPRRARALWTHTDGHLLEDVLVGRDVIWGDPGQAPSFDLPGQRRQPAVQHNRSWLWQDVNDTLGPVAQMYGDVGEVAAYDLGLSRLARARSRSLWTGSNWNVLDTLVGQDTIYAAPGEVPTYDWQLPKLARRARSLWTHADWDVLDTLVGQDQLYDDPGEVPVYDWPLPQAPRRARALWTHTLGDLFDVLVGQDTIYGAAGEAPAYDWQLPRLARGRSRSLWSHTDEHLLDVLLGQDAVYGAGGQAPSYDLPGQRRQLPIQHNRTWGWQNINDTLAPIAQMYADIGEVPSYDWQLPKLARRVRSLWTHTDEHSLDSLFGQDVLYAPGEVQPYDWPRTPPKVGSRSLWTYTLGDLSDVLLGQDSQFGAPGESPSWDLPGQRRQLPIQHNRTWLWQDLNDTLAFQSMYADPGEVPAYDWQLPKLARRARALWTHTDGHLLEDLLIGLDVVWGAAGQVPTYDLPGQRKQPPTPVNRTWLWQDINDTLAPVAQMYGDVGEVPAFDLVLPRLARARSRSLWTFVDWDLLDTLAGQDTIYGALGEVPNYDLPGQRRVLPTQHNRTWLWQDANDTLSGQSMYGDIGEAPVYDMPGMSRPKERSRALWTHTLGDLLDVLAGQDAMYGAPGESPAYDWQLPKLPRRVRALWTHVDEHLLDVLVGQDTVYGDPGEAPVYTWIVPARVPSRPGLRVHIDGHLLNVLFSQDSIYAAPGQAAVYEWQLPKLPRRLRDYTISRSLDLRLLAQDVVYGAPGQAAVYEWQLPKLPRRLRDYAWRSWLPMPFVVVQAGSVRGGSSPGRGVSGGSSPARNVRGGSSPARNVRGGDSPRGGVSGGSDPAGDVKGGVSP